MSHIAPTPHNPDPNTPRLVLLVPKPHVKEVKSALEKHAHFDRHNGISLDPETQQMRIPTTLLKTTGTSESTTDLLASLNLTHLSPAITLSSCTPPPTPPPQNPLRRALAEALHLLPAATLAPLNLSIHTLLSSFPDAYSIYPPLLLLSTLPAPWTTLITHHAPTLEPVWSHMATSLGCTHMALNAPIPPSNTSPSYAHDTPNHLRSPVNLIPLHGDFGPAPTPLTLSHPTAQDFQTAFWVSVTQNGIRQTWAPRYTMFSRGNVKEKARVLHLPSVTSLVSDKHARNTHPDSAAALDLYAGIGYFAFSYRKAGFKRVLAWEMNPWSVEGMRRGCVMNGWTVSVVTEATEGSPETEGSDIKGSRNAPPHTTGSAKHPPASTDFLIFLLSNTTSASILPHLTPSLAVIRHVNLGLLPLSRPAWPLAVAALLHAQGGWIHAHENVGVEEVEARSGEVEREFRRLWRDAGGEGGDVTVEHVERVKMYAPGVVHVVFDVCIPGMTATDKRRDVMHD